MQHVALLLIDAKGSMATYETGSAEGSPGRHAAGGPGTRPAARVRHHGGAASGQRRSVRPPARHHLPGPAPPGTGRPGRRDLVRGGRTPAPRLRADPGRPPHTGHRARQLAAVLRRRHRHARTRAPAGDLVTGRPGRQLVEDYLAEVGARLPGPARERASILAELRGGLLDTVDAHRDAGVSAAGTAAAAHASADTATADATAAHAAADTAADVAAAIEEFGDPGLVAAAFGPGLAPGQARRVALTLLVTGPLVGLLWATAATASHIGSRQVPPWHWVGALPGSLMVFPLAAAITIAVWTALFTIAATGRATRWLPDRPRLAPGAAAVAGFGAAGADVALFVPLASPLTLAPGRLPAAPPPPPAAARAAP